MGRTPGGSPNVRATVSRRSSTQDGLRSVPTRRVASPLLGFRLLKTPGHVALKSERENKMRWMIVGTMVAAGSLSATAVRAQESDAGSGAIATEHSARSAVTSIMQSDYAIFARKHRWTLSIRCAEDAVMGDQRQPLDLSLGDKQAVERIVVNCR